MIRVLLAVLAFTLGVSPQQNQDAKAVREEYTKFEFEIPMRDGLRLFTAVYVPKDSSQTYPIMLERTPYSVEPYGVDRYPTSLGPSEKFRHSGYIFAYQDVRGRYMSEGTWEEMRPYKPDKSGPKDVDDSSDTWDTIDWLVKNIPGNNGKVGMWGVSYPGFYVSAGMIDAHPALVAASPQAPVTDLYLGDDAYHNGAYMLEANFGFYRFFWERKGPPSTGDRQTPFDYGTPDGYDFFLRMGPLANANAAYFKGENRYWNEMVENTTYNDYWKARAIWKYLKGIKPAVMTVGGLFDAEDCQGPLRTHAFMEQNGPPPIDMLVLGPWTHGSWSWTDGDRVGNMNFASKTGIFFRDEIEFPFFESLLKGKGDRKFPKAWVFETGTNRWSRYEHWPPIDAQPKSIYLQSGGRLGMVPETRDGYDEYTSDPQTPVPYLGYTAIGMRGDYMTEDQRFAAQRPDVLTYETEVLKDDLRIAGPVGVNLLVSTTGTDSDFVVKLIDVYPGDYPDYSAPPRRDGERPSGSVPANAVKMGAYQQLVRGEPFRGKFRRGFEKPTPFEPGKPDRIEFSMPDVSHVFRRGHRIMVQVQSSWFPLTDLNPQRFVEIPHAQPGDFQKATERVYRGGTGGSRLVIGVIGGRN